MNRTLWILLGLVAALAFAGCSFKGGTSGGDNGGTLSVSGGQTSDDNKNSPGAGLVEMVAVLGCALLVRRRLDV
jgi:hypothetical protein